MFPTEFPANEPGGHAGDQGPMKDLANWSLRIPTSFRQSTFEFACYFGCLTWF